MRESAKGPDGQGLTEMKEDHMNGITSRADLCGLTLADLQALHHTVEQELLSAQPGSAGWRDAITSLDVIELAIAQRCMRGPGF
jgi:hypothetical protein